MTPVEFEAQLEALHAELAAANMAPTWKYVSEFVSRQPRTSYRPWLWKWHDVIPLLMRAGDLITPERGLEGDHKGLKFRRRAITVLAREAWEAALTDLAGPVTLPWTTRRANLYVEGVRLPRALGGQVRIGGWLKRRIGLNSAPEAAGE